MEFKCFVGGDPKFHCKIAIKQFDDVKEANRMIENLKKYFKDVEMRVDEECIGECYIMIRDFENDFRPLFVLDGDKIG